MLTIRERVLQTSRKCRQQNHGCDPLPMEQRTRRAETRPAARYNGVAHVANASRRARSEITTAFLNPSPDLLGGPRKGFLNDLEAESLGQMASLVQVFGLGKKVVKSFAYFPVSPLPFAAILPTVASLSIAGAA
jgi:hypothetical protein